MIKKIDKELAKKALNLFYFTNGNLKIGFIITLDSSNIDHANSILSTVPIYVNAGIETRYSD